MFEARSKAIPYQIDTLHLPSQTRMTNLTPNSSFSLTIRFQVPNRPGMLASVTKAVSSLGGNMGQIDLIEQTRQLSLRDITIDAASTEHAETIVAAVKALPDIKVLNVYDRTFDLHRGGKITVESRIPLRGQADLAMAYTPGVGRICTAIAEDPEKAYTLTIKQIPWRSSPMAVLCWVWATLAPKRRYR